MTQFVPGRELCRGFFHEIAEPILRAHFPELRYSAGLLGYGSDVLGYDDEISTDHMWGPRFYLFLREDDIALKDSIEATFAREFPYTYHGYSVNFSAPDPNDGGVRVAQPIESGNVSPLVFIYTRDAFLNEYLGTANLNQLDSLDWLALSEHRLLGLAQGVFFVDELDFATRLDAIRVYPEAVARYLIASQWALIGEEQAFVTRTGMRGDELGARILCARIVERLMRLCFLYGRQYAPYSKWFGTAFARLPIDAAIGIEMNAALRAIEVDERERHLVAAQLLVAELHNRSALVPSVEVRAGNYHGRAIQVINAEGIANAVAAELVGTSLAGIPLIGSMSQVGNFVALSDDPSMQQRIRQLFEP